MKKKKNAGRDALDYERAYARCSQKSCRIADGSRQPRCPAAYLHSLCDAGFAMMPYMIWLAAENGHLHV